MIVYKQKNLKNKVNQRRNMINQNNIKLPHNIYKVSASSNDFLSLTKSLYSDVEQPHTSQPKKQHLLNCYVLKNDDVVVGRFALYHNPSIKIKGAIIITVGSYECVDDIEISKILIQNIKSIAKAYNATKLIGPMEGATWHNYRFSIDNSKPLFFTEVKHQSYYVNQFTTNGFKVLKTYSSTIDNDIKVNENRLAEFKDRFAKQNLTIRHIDITQFEQELTKIGEFCNETFSKNYLFSPLAVADFVAKYISIKPFVNPELFYIVENDAKQIQAFMFCIPNYLDESKQSIIVKSMATLPIRELAGLQIYLGEIMYAKALKLGYSKAIHAYMIDDNMSKGLSKKFNADVYQTHHLYYLDV